MPLDSEIAVKQANKLIESIYKMDVNEHKLLLLATKKVNEMEFKNEPFNERTRITISSSEFAKQYGISRPSAFEIIVDAKNSIYDREFVYLHIENDGTVEPMRSRWFQARQADKAKGEISFMFASAVIPLIYLVKSEYTLLDLQEIGQLKSKYAVRLYKYLMRWVNAPYKNKVSIEQLREIFGLENDEYPEMCDFKKRVLDIAVKQVKAGTGFKDLTVKNYKTGVKVTAFSFHYTSYSNELFKKSKKQVIEADIDPDKKLDEYVVHQMTDEQITAFSSALAVKASKGEYGYTHLGSLVGAGDGTSVLIDHIADDFKKGLFAPYLSALKLSGFKPKKINKTPLVRSTSENKASEEDTQPISTGKGQNNPFDLPDNHYALYVKKGGQLSKDQILEIAMAENTEPMRIMLADGINIRAV